MSNTNVSRKIVEQRVRNRLIEWLEVLTSYEADPPQFDLNELLNQWDDWNPPESSYAADVYSATEVEHLALVAGALGGFCKATPPSISVEADALVTPEWMALVLAGRSALTELHLRGRLSEDVEVCSGSSSDPVRR